MYCFEMQLPKQNRPIGVNVYRLSAPVSMWGKRAGGSEIESSPLTMTLMTLRSISPRAMMRPSQV